MQSFDPRTAAQYMEEARDVIIDEIIRSDQETPDFWVEWMPKRMLPLGKGYRGKQKIYNQSYISASSASWRSLKDQIDSGEGCAIAPETIRFGSTFVEWDTEILDFRGPDICLLEILSLQDYAEELERQREQLARVRRVKLSNKFRDAYLLMAGRHYTLMDGLPHHVGQFPMTDALNTSTLTPADPYVGVGLPHESALSRIATYFDSVGGYVAGQHATMMGGQPMYWAIGSQEAFDTMIRQDLSGNGSTSMGDTNDAAFEFLRRRFHIGQYWGRYLLVNDPQAPRFRWSAASSCLERVEYFREVPTDIGSKQEPNPDYETAPYEAMILVANRRGPECLEMPQISQIGQHNFGPSHTAFALDWINYGANCDNPKRYTGYWLGNMILAINPRESQFVVALLFARNVGSITVSSPAHSAAATPAAAPICDAPLVERCCLVPETCCDGQMVCTEIAAVTVDYDQAITIGPILDGTVADGDIVVVAGAPSGLEFRVTTHATPNINAANNTRNWMLEWADVDATAAGADGLDADALCAMVTDRWQLAKV